MKSFPFIACLVIGLRRYAPRGKRKVERGKWKEGSEGEAPGARQLGMGRD